MRGLPSRSGPVGANKFRPALMQGELDCNRRLPEAESTSSGALGMLPTPLVGSGDVQE